MKKNIILLVAISLSLGGCGIYTKYEPATVVPDNLYGGGRRHCRSGHYGLAGTLH